MKDAVVFDFDGTLTTRDTTRFLVLALLAQRPWRIPGAWLLAARYKLGSLTPQEFRIKITSWALKGVELEGAGRALARYVRVVQQHLRPGMVNRLTEFTSQGALTLIATASPAFAVSKVFPEVPVIGSDWEVCQGRFTGLLTGQDCYEQEKARRVQDYFASQGIEALRAAFSDNLADAPLLKMAQQPFLVCPDPRTRGALSEYPVIEK